jgi:hypothetical protein
LAENGVSDNGADETTANNIVDLARTVLYNSKPWRIRQKAVDQIGKLAKERRMIGQLDSLLNELSVVPRFVQKLLGIATDLDQPELLRRTAAWAISEMNEWPARFNSKVLTDKRIAASTAIDASLTFQPELGNVKEMTPEEQVQYAKKFLPHIDAKGFELRWDTKKNFVGPFFRVLRHPDNDAKICVQYLYTWSRQSWPISSFFTYYLWPMLGLLSLLPELVGSIVSFAIVALAIIMIVWGAIRTLHPQKTRCFKNDTWYVVGGVVLAIGVGLQSMLGYIWSFVIVSFAAVVLWVVVRFVLGDIEHVMDYAPVLIYLRKIGVNWRIERVRTDLWHYETVDFAGNALQTNSAGDTIFLETDNVWHSFKNGHSHGTHSSLGYQMYAILWVVVYASAFAIIGIGVAQGTFHMLSFLPSVNTFGLVFYSLVATMGLILLNDKSVTPISDPSNLKIVDVAIFDEWQRRILTYNKLLHLWNMADEKADLVIRRKLQNPFRTWRDKSFWKSFRDPPSENLAYEALARIRRFEKNERHPVEEE